MLRPVGDAARRARFQAWALRADIQLRKRGSRLVLDAPYGARFDTPPVIQFTPQGLSRPLSGRGEPALVLKIGRNVDLGRELVFELRADGHNVVEIGDHSTFLGHGRVILFDGTITMGRETQVRTFAILKSSAVLKIGDVCTISHQSMVHCGVGIELEDRVTIGERVSVLDSDHALDGGDEYNMTQGDRYSPIRLGRNAFIGANSVILRGANIGRNTLVGAGAVVRGGEYPDGHLIAGSPARAVRELSPAEPGRP
jgi:acetyltransferase-like isoleucine patch superfamily enzyme